VPVLFMPRFNAAEYLKGVTARRTREFIGLARGGVKFRPLVKRAARTNDLRSGHQDYAGEPALVPEQTAGLRVSRSCRSTPAQ
jgi:hypothetical protein